MIPKASKPSLGIMNLQQGEQKFQLSRHIPSEDLAYFIRHYWIVRWDLTNQEPYLQHVIPNPCVNLLVEPGRTAIYGPGKENLGICKTKDVCSASNSSLADFTLF